MVTQLESKLVQLADNLDGYHQRRADVHGYLYISIRSFGLGSLVETKSIATGVLCTLDRRFLKDVDDAT